MDGWRTKQASPPHPHRPPPQHSSYYKPSSDRRFSEKDKRGEVDVSAGQVLAQATSKTLRKGGATWYVFTVNARAVVNRKAEVLTLAAPSVDDAKGWLRLMGNTNSKNQSLFSEEATTTTV